MNTDIFIDLVIPILAIILGYIIRKYHIRTGLLQKILFYLGVGVNKSDDLKSLLLNFEKFLENATIAFEDGKLTKEEFEQLKQQFLDLKEEFLVLF